MVVVGRYTDFLIFLNFTSLVLALFMQLHRGGFRGASGALSHPFRILSRLVCIARTRSGT